MQPPPGPPGYPGGFAPPPGVPHAGGFGHMPPPPRPASTSSDAIISLVLAVVTMSSSCFPMGFVAFYFGSKAKKKAREEGDTGSNVTLATVGQIMGMIFGILWLLFWLFEAVMIFLGVGLAIFAGP
jgi:hypothetical protein